jgi:hypothetical protein
MAALVSRSGRSHYVEDASMEALLALLDEAEDLVS